MGLIEAGEVGQLDVHGLADMILTRGGWQTYAYHCQWSVRHGLSVRSCLPRLCKARARNPQIVPSPENYQPGIPRGGY